MTCDELAGYIRGEQYSYLTKAMSEPPPPNCHEEYKIVLLGEDVRDAISSMPSDEREAWTTFISNCVDELDKAIATSNCTVEFGEVPDKGFLDGWDDEDEGFSRHVPSPEPDPSQLILI